MPLSWDKLQDDVDRFREDFVFADIVRTEVETNSMLEWMGILPMHKFLPRHFEEDATREPLARALANVKSSVDQNVPASLAEEEESASLEAEDD